MPAGTALFYTTLDFDGRLDATSVPRITAFLRDRFRVDASLTTCTQVHGAAVRLATASAPDASAWRECDSCDALWTGETGAALGIKVADCLPVSMVDSEASVVANIHSGWRGTVQKIVRATIDAVRADSTFSAARSLAFLGPTIRQCCFEVGEEVVDEFRRLRVRPDRPPTALRPLSARTPTREEARDRVARPPRRTHGFSSTWRRFGM